MVYSLFTKDISVLECMHASETIFAMKQQERNIFSKFSNEEIRHCTRRIIENILATDMAYHFKLTSNIKSKVDAYKIVNGKNIDRLIFPDNLTKTYENQQMILDILVHCSDISNPIKPYDINKIWVDKVLEEFFNQGDVELSEGLPISLLCDRKTTDRSKSQIGFINFVVKPVWDCLYMLCPEIYLCLDIMNNNLKKYEQLLAESQEKK